MIAAGGTAKDANHAIEREIGAGSVLLPAPNRLLEHFHRGAHLPSGTGVRRAETARSFNVLFRRPIPAGPPPRAGLARNAERADALPNDRERRVWNSACSTNFSGGLGRPRPRPSPNRLSRWTKRSVLVWMSCGWRNCTLRPNARCSPRP